MNRKTDWPESFTLSDLRWMCECAKRTLIAEGHYKPDAFIDSDGEICCYAPVGLIHPDSDHPNLAAYCDPLPGTPLIVNRDYWTGEEDCDLPIYVLSEIVFWSGFTAEDYERMARGEAA